MDALPRSADGCPVNQGLKQLLAQEGSKAFPRTEPRKTTEVGKQGSLMSKAITEERSQTLPLSGSLAIGEGTQTSDRRRFCVSLSIGAVIVLLPYLWVLTVLWNPGPSLFRTVLPHQRLSNFYELQGRALLAGHIYVPNGALGEEAFVHGGHQYMYFGLFPSLIRLPAMVLTHSLDGRMTAISILAAWILTAVMSAIILWHCRVTLRGPAGVGYLEAGTYAAAFAAMLGGSALVNLAANPWVYSEDIAWSVALRSSPPLP